MDNIENRFECRVEDNGLYLVWDIRSNAPATLGGCALRGRLKERAEAACAILQKIYRNRLDAWSIQDDAGLQQKSQSA
jgi:hypothetical protein